MESGVSNTRLFFYGGVYMKKLEIVVDIEKLEDMKEALHLSGVTDMTLSGIIGDKRCKNRKVSCYKHETVPAFLNKFRIEVIVSDSMLLDVMNQIMKVMNLSSIQDGCISIYKIKDELGTADKMAF